MEQLSINLTSDISYVSGTVNGEVAEFSLTSPGIWSAIVDKADDGRYEVNISAYNNLGSVTEYNTVIYKLEGMIPPKTDWTSDDYYNAEDLNRVEANTQYVAEYLESIGYKAPIKDTRIDRSIESVDFISSINRVESNIEAMKDVFIKPPGYLDGKTWVTGKGFNYQDANRYERNLELLHHWGENTEKEYKYCGEIYCGEEVI